MINCTSYWLYLFIMSLQVENIITSLTINPILIEVASTMRRWWSQKTKTLMAWFCCVKLITACICCVPSMVANCNWQVSSLSETKAHQVMQQKASSFNHFNQRQLSRIYPSSYRVDSSNFNPQPFWNAGCQLGMLLHTLTLSSLWLNSSYKFCCRCLWLLQHSLHFCACVFFHTSSESICLVLVKTRTLRITAADLKKGTQ